MMVTVRQMRQHWAVELRIEFWAAKWLVATARLVRVNRTFFANTLSKASSSASNAEGASSSLSSRFRLEGAQSLLDVASTAWDGFANSGKALAFEILPKVRSVDCLLTEDIERYQRLRRCSAPSVFGHEVGSRYGFRRRKERLTTQEIC